jgi:TolA-binding protein
MIRITLLASLALLASAAATDARPGRSGNGSPAATSPSATIERAISEVDARLEHLRKMQMRRATGKRVTLNEVRSAGVAPARGREVLEKERQRIETLRDEIRVILERQAAPAVVRAPEPEPKPEKPAVPEIEPTPVPEDHGLRLRLATLRYRAGRYEEALALYESVAEESGDTWAILRTARCNERLGRIPSARRIYERLIADHPDDPWAKSAARSLSILDLGRKPETARGDG